MGRLIRLDLTVPQARYLLRALEAHFGAGLNREDAERAGEISEKLHRERDRLISDADKMRAAGGRYPGTTPE